MSKVNFTVARIDSFKCPEGSQQAFLWDSRSPGLGLRATIGGSKSYIFQGKIHSKTVRITIGDPRSWSIELAQEEARRLQRLIDEGTDPRLQKAEQAVENEQRRMEVQRQETTFEEAWLAYLNARHSYWSDRHYRDHLKHAHAGGELPKRGKDVTKPGPLAFFRTLKLTELTADCVANWLSTQNIERPTMAALSYRLLRAFIRWADETPEYQGLIPGDAHSARRVKEAVSRSKTKDGDCLQREQLKAWFAAVRHISNPVISAYLQGLLITGARREELARLRWEDVDFRWGSLRIADKVDAENGRQIPLTPYFAMLLQELKELSPHQQVATNVDASGTSTNWVFTSKTSADGKVVEPRLAHNKALAEAGLPHLSLHGLRRSFGTLAEWVECPTGIVAQIMGHRPSAIAEKHYRRRPIDLLRMWHDKIEGWMLKEAGIDPRKAKARDREPLSLAEAFVKSLDSIKRNRAAKGTSN